MKNRSDKSGISRVKKAGKPFLLVMGIAILAFAGGYFVRTYVGGSQAPADLQTEQTERTPLFWGCSMHPNVTSREPGDKCFVCGMELTLPGDATKDR